MKVHHLNCGTMRPPVGGLSVAHVLLVETAEHLVLVDAGYGLGDIADPSRIGPARHLIRPDLLARETAAHQVRALGYEVRDVRHIVATHLDVDHIGGLSDFPDAVLHTTATEKAAAYHGSLRSVLRYRRGQLPPQARVRAHAPGAGSWHEFPGATYLSEIAEGIVLLPLPGHTRGHAAVAVDAGSHWVLHCGDAFFHQATLRRTAIPAALRLTEAVLADQPHRIAGNHARLAVLHATQPGATPIRIVCAHDPQMLADAQAADAGW
ncbi:MBL fold metallo-hydrolase [Nocardia rhizosphaerae]|uniref:MBL fold metallo-hydrolase n=1 Tax=Nocardia rhizosphaerae TaxID=1691571 RepID=A0ABV8LC33_9NOCA